MKMRVSVQWCNDANSARYGYVFRYKGKVIAECEESDYHETVEELKGMGYIING